MNDFIDGIEAELIRLNAQIISLKAGLKEAMEWNWLDDDMPRIVLEQLEALLEDIHEHTPE